MNNIDQICSDYFIFKKNKEEEKRKEIAKRKNHELAEQKKKKEASPIFFLICFVFILFVVYLLNISIEENVNFDEKIIPVNNIKTVIYFYLNLKLKYKHLIYKGIRIQ
jgi:hypothetical protein